MPVLNSTKQLQTYTARDYPQVEGGQGRYITFELQRISVVFNQLIQATKALDARLQAGGL